MPDTLDSPEPHDLPVDDTRPEADTGEPSEGYAEDTPDNPEVPPEMAARPDTDEEAPHAHG
jgi:hypothetical protein